MYEFIWNETKGWSQIGWIEYTARPRGKGNTSKQKVLGIVHQPHLADVSTINALS